MSASQKSSHDAPWEMWGQRLRGGNFCMRLVRVKDRKTAFGADGRFNPDYSVGTAVKLVMYMVAQCIQRDSPLVLTR